MQDSHDIREAKVLANQKASTRTSHEIVPRQRKLLRVHVDLAQPRDAARQLQESLHALEDAHVGEANLFYEFELGVLGQRGDGFCDFEHGRDDVVARVAEVPGELSVSSASQSGRM
jgi:hypothetical protein